MSDLRATLLVTVAEESIFEKDLLASTHREIENNQVELLTFRGAPSQAWALNRGIEQAKADLIICPHQDVYFESGWLKTVERMAETAPKAWGVLGGAGTDHNGRMWGTHSGLGMAEPNQSAYQHVTVMTLDGSLLILRKSSGLRFDEQLNRFHGYDVDICLESWARGLACYAINLPMQHRTKWMSTTRPGGADDFQNALRYVAQKWHARGVGPIYTTFGTY